VTALSGTTRNKLSKSCLPLYAGRLFLFCEISTRAFTTAAWPLPAHGWQRQLCRGKFSIFSSSLWSLVQLSEKIFQSWGFRSQKNNFIEQFNKVRCWPSIWILQSSVFRTYTFFLSSVVQLGLILLSFPLCSSPLFRQNYVFILLTHNCGQPLAHVFLFF